MCRLARHLILALVLALSAALPASVQAQPPAESDPVKRLAAIWESQEKEIGTAHLKYRIFRRGGELAPITSEQLHAILSSVDLQAHPDDLKKVIAKLLLVPLPSERPWGVCESYFEGNKIKEIDAASGTWTQVFDGKEKIEYNKPNRYAKLAAPGASSLYLADLNAFRYVPKSHFSPLRLDGRENDLLILRGGDARIVVEEMNGALHNLQLARNGTVVKEIIQGTFTTYPGDVVFPSLRLAADYSQAGILVSIELSWIEEATFNADLPEKTFTLSVPAGTNVFDERDRDRVRTFSTRQEVDNIASFANQKRFGSAPIAGPTSQNYVWVTVLASGLVLCFLLAYWILRKRTMPG